MATATNLPTCKLTETDGNVFSVIGRVSECLKRAGLPDRAEEFCNAAMASDSYEAVLRLCFEYVDVE